ncbi:MAG: thermonuclease family protein [Sneathiella sp.]|nr:thermonuclease family protein [Sneathiella sp.]
MRHLVLAAGLGLIWLTGHAIPAESDETYVVTGISQSRILTDQEISVSLYGVRLADPKSEFYQACQTYFRDFLFGRPITVEETSFPDNRSIPNRYGDLQAKIVTDKGKWLQEELIAAGFGWWDGATNYPTDLRMRLIAAEERAENQKRGVWKTFAVVDANDPKQHLADGAFVIAEGIIRDIHSASGITFLNFGDNWRSDFTAAISKESRKNFERQGWKLASLKNKLVRIRGLLRFYNGPFMDLGFPEQLDVKEVKGGLHKAG